MGLDCVFPEADPRQELERMDFVGSGAGGNSDVRREGHQVGGAESRSSFCRQLMSLALGHAVR